LQHLILEHTRLIFLVLIAILRSGREVLQLEQEKLIEYVQGLDVAKQNNPSVFVRLDNRLSVVGLSLEKLQPELFQKMQEVIEQREREVNDKVGRGILWKSDLEDRFSRPIAGGKGSHSGEIVGALEVMIPMLKEQYKDLFQDVEVINPLGFVIQPEEYKLWQESGKPDQLDDELKQTLTIGYRDLIVQQTRALLEFVEKDERTDSELKSELGIALNHYLAVENIENMEAINSLIGLARRLVLMTLQTTDKEISRSLRNRLMVLGSVAVRSSGLKEDSVQDSMAGMKESKLNASGLKQLFESVVDVWKSGAEGVLIEEMINAKSSVLAFSADAVFQRTDRIRINAVHGIAKGLVEKPVKDPDSIVIEKRENGSMKFEVVETHVGAKSEKVVLDLEKGGTKFVGSQEAAGLAIDEKQIQIVAAVTNALAQYFGFQADIEASFDSDDRLVILQVRPIATIQGAMDSGLEYLLAGDSAMMVQKNVGADNALTAPGGIDFNPDKMDLTTQGNGMDLNFREINLNVIDPAMIFGIQPVIIEIIPINLIDIPMILGVAQKHQNPTADLSDDSIELIAKLN